MPTFDEWQFAPDGTAPPDAGEYVPPGNTRDEQLKFCHRNAHDPIVGSKCMAWLRKEVWCEKLD